MTSFAHAAAQVASGTASRGAIARICAALAAVLARAKARHDYRRLMECDEIMRDVGVSRDEVRRALLESGGRL